MKCFFILCRTHSFGVSGSRLLNNNKKILILCASVQHILIYIKKINLCKCLEETN